MDNRDKPRTLESAIYRRGEDLQERYPSFVAASRESGQQGAVQSFQQTRSQPPGPMPEGETPKGDTSRQDSWCDRNNPFARADGLIKDPAMASTYKKIMSLGLTAFLVTIIGLIVSCSWFNWLGFLHIAPALYPLFGVIINASMYAAVTGFALLIAFISLLVGLFSSCIIAALIFGCIFISLNIWILYYLTRFDPDVRRNWNNFYKSCSCTSKKHTTDPTPMSSSTVANPTNQVYV